MDDLGRVVVVQAGFALWKGGRCIAAGRWADIRQIRATRLASDETAARLVMELMDGTVLEMHENAPGFTLFLKRGAATLSGLIPVDVWRPALFAAPSGGEGALLFERPEPRQPRLSR